MTWILTHWIWFLICALSGISGVFGILVYFGRETENDSVTELTITGILIIVALSIIALLIGLAGLALALIKMLVLLIF